MKIIIPGGTGFIGRHLSALLTQAGHTVIVLSRNPQRAQSLFNNKIQCFQWKNHDASAWQKELETTDVIINLIGENLARWPWTKSFKKRILESRVNAGRTITQAVKSAGKKPKLLIQSSAVGYYGNQSHTELTEDSPNGNGFIADVCRQWEASTADVESLGTSRIIIRTGLVLGENEGLLDKMATPFKLFLGGPVGSGEQVMPWIHIDDQVNAIRFLSENKVKSGIYNLCSPNPVTMNAFAEKLGKTLHRPSFFRVPEFAVKLALGEMGRETVLVSQNVKPEALITAGYTYKYPQLCEALDSIYN
ncbi:MAG: TIGR01777 family oxidoreductase [Calditrichaceae bacterium]